MQVTNTLAYWVNFVSYEKKKCGEYGPRARFFEQTLMFSSSCRCDQICKYERYDFGHTLQLLSATLQESGDGGIFFSDDETFDVKQVQFRERDCGPLLLADDHHREVVEVFAHDRLGPDNNDGKS